ncbi:AAA family ATPase [Irregularibacter muris]|uniref:AAA family ATPase n=1 Tax=Irregularibacter muris TaxID=1796619 RepID=A0AAE3HF09_9FIRM|nr:AAA family ATPase [Irregularibacter muris]MCR1897958.1 AAA family ATPase [Irregularibacter muris]
MKIRAAHIQGFGKFMDETFNFSPGLNIIFGNNEAGKTTLRNFLFHMLYGQKKYGVKKRIYLPVQELYSPWNHYTYQGILRYTLGDTSYSIERNFHSDFEEVRVFKEDRGEDISTLFPTDIRKELQFMKEQIGLSERAFKNTVLIEQNEMVGLLYQNKENIFEELVGKVVYSIEGEKGQKTIRDIIGSLEKDKKEIGTPKNKRSLLGIAYENLRKMGEKKYNIENERESYYQDQEFLIEIVEQEKRLEIKEQKLYLNKEYLESQNLRDKIKTIEEILYEKQELEKYINRNFPFSIQQSSLEKIQREREKNHHINRKFTLLCGAFIGIGILFALWWLIFPYPILQLPLVLLSILLGAWGLLRKENLNKKSKALFEQLDKVNQYQDALKELQRLQERLKEETKEYSFEDLKNKMKALEVNRETNFIPSCRDLYSIELELEEIQKQKKDLLEERVYLEVKIKNSKWNPMTLEEVEEEIFAIEKKIKEMEDNIQAIDITISTFEKLENDEKTRWLPSITKQIQETIYKITKKYHIIKIDEQYKIKTVDPYSGRLISIDELSWGTFCQFYFAMRMSLVQLLSPKPICLPMILDEPFIYFDDERFEESMKLLKDLSKQHQIIILTSQYREKQYVDQNNYQYEYIELK